MGLPMTAYSDYGRLALPTPLGGLKKGATIKKASAIKKSAAKGHHVLDGRLPTKYKEPNDDDEVVGLACPRAKMSAR